MTEYRICYRSLVPMHTYLYIQAESPDDAINVAKESFDKSFRGARFVDEDEPTDVSIAYIDPIGDNGAPDSENCIAETIDLDSETERPDWRKFVSTVAHMTKEGDRWKEDGELVEHEVVDAFDTLEGLISTARRIMNMPETMER